MVEWVPFTDPPPRRRPTDLNLRRRILDLAESPRRSGERQAGPGPLPALPRRRAAAAAALHALPSIKAPCCRVLRRRRRMPRGTSGASAPDGSSATTRPMRRRSRSRPSAAFRRPHQSYLQGPSALRSENSRVVAFYPWLAHRAPALPSADHKNHQQDAIKDTAVVDIGGVGVSTMVSTPARGNKHIRFLLLLAGLAVVRPFAVDIQNWEKVSSVPVGTNGTTTMQMISLAEYPEVSVYICSEHAVLFGVFFNLVFRHLWGVHTRPFILCPCRQLVPSPIVRLCATV